MHEQAREVADLCFQGVDAGGCCFDLVRRPASGLPWLRPSSVWAAERVVGATEGVCSTSFVWPRPPWASLFVGWSVCVGVAVPLVGSIGKSRPSRRVHSVLLVIVHTFAVSFIVVFGGALGAHC